MSNQITFGISTRNNLDYLKLAVYSVRKYSYFTKCPFIIVAENCDKDHTYDWLKSNQDRYNFEYYIENNSEDKILGIGGGMNKIAEKVKTEYIMFLHADFFVSQNWDLECLKIFDKYPNTPMWVSSQRFQPNIWKEKARPGTEFFDYESFGYKYDNFKEEDFIEYAREFSKINSDIEYNKGEGVSGLIKTKDFLYNDQRFSPSFFEDKDLFIRCQLAGYRFILTTNSVIFHFGSRSETSNFPDDNNLVKSDKSKFYEQRSGKRFFEKWGFWPVQNEHQFDIFPPHLNKENYKHLIKIK